jgi:Leucine-rich repeat (LRR) protein
MITKNYLIILILLLLFACGGDHNISVPPIDIELSISEKIFINDLESVLGNTIDLNLLSSFTTDNQGGINYYRIQSLNLSGLGLLSIPESIGNLDSLEILYLDDNQLESLPDTLCSCPLTELTLSNNTICLTSSLPICVQEYYDVMNQNCVAYPDENDLEFLDELVLMNGILDSLEEIIKNDRVTWEIKFEGESLVQRIIKLDLENLNLDTIPFSIGGLDHLKWIEFENNNLTSIPASIGSLGQLWFLDLYNNQIIDLPSSFQYLTELKELYLYSNKLTELDFSFSNLINLEKLWINNNEISLIDSSICEIIVNLEFYFNDNKLCNNQPPCMLNIDLDEQNCAE